MNKDNNSEIVIPDLFKCLVTIAIPAYKNKWLAEAIESALNQDYDNIEVIVVDDHSPYNLKRIVAPYLKDKRVRYYFNDHNLGKKSIVYNWNRCVDYAQGEFFVLLCDDDVLLPNFVSSLLNLVKKYPKCNVFHGRRAVISEITADISEDNVWPEFEDFDDFLSEKNRGHRKHTITEFLFKTSVIKKTKYEIFPIGYFSDDATILKLAKDGGVASVKEITCFFRKSEEHISGNIKLVFDKAKAAILYYNWYQNNIDLSLSNKKKNDLIDLWVSYYFMKADSISKVKLLFLVPNGVWSIKQKLYLFLKLLSLKK